MDFIGKRILLAEDEKLNQFVIKKNLENHHLHVTTADNGQIAVDRFSESAFDLVLLDINMPVMDGFDAARLMKQHNVQIPIIALTGNDFLSIENQLNEAGFSDYVEKPIVNERLIEKISKWLNN